MKQALTAVIAFLIICFNLEAIENSVVPTVEYFECLENLSAEKYAPGQYAKIVSALAHKEERIRLVTYNVLFNINDHKLDEAYRWPARLPRVVAILEEMQPDIIAVQELYPDQLKDLRPHLQECFAFYGERGGEGELNGIFYREDRFELLGSRVYVTPNSSTIHIAEALTMVQLKDLKTGKQLAVFNTHLPFSPPYARESYARWVVDHIEPVAKLMPVLLTGDLNTFPNRPDLKKMPFYDGEYICSILTEKALTDAKDLALIGHLGPLSTFSNLGEDTTPFKGTGTPGVFLDHIFVSKAVSVFVHAVQPGTLEGYFPSDHLPLFIDFIVD